MRRYPEGKSWPLGCIEARDADGIKSISRRFPTSMGHELHKLLDVDQVINVLG